MKIGAIAEIKFSAEEMKNETRHQLAHILIDAMRAHRTDAQQNGGHLA